MEKVRVGIIGCGGIARAHISGYTANPDVELVSFFDKEPGQAEKFVQKYGGKAYDNLSTMLEKEKFDAVSICTPPVAHKDAAILALDHGVNVLCEKPISLNASNGIEMVNKAKQVKKYLMTAFSWRFHKEIKIAKKLVEEGKLGKIVMVRNTFAGWGDMSQRWFSKREISGGGALIDAGIHSVDLYRFLFGEIKTVWGQIQTIAQPIEVEDIARVMLKTETGIVGSLDISWSVGIGPSTCFEIYGSEGTVLIEWSSIRYRRRDEKDWTVEASNLPEDDAFRNETKHFINVVLGKEKPVVDGVDGIRAVEIIEAAYKSAEKNQWHPVTYSKID